MKKSVLLIGFLLMLRISDSSAQQPIFVQGSTVINASLGLGSTLFTGFGYKPGIPPISASLEYGIKDKIIDKGSIGIGAYGGFSSYKWEYQGWGWKYNTIILGGRGIFHYPFIDKFDTYTGVMIGFRVVSATEFGTKIPYDYSPAGSGLVGSWFIGGRYYLTDNFALLGELGYGIAYFNIGVAMKIR
jgi:hypothetical protein